MRWSISFVIASWVSCGVTRPGLVCICRPIRPKRKSYRAQATFSSSGEAPQSATLSSQRAVLRLRFFDNDSRCVLSLKAKPVLINGVSRVEEDEEEIDPLIGRECVADPSKLSSIESRILKRCKDEFGIVEGMGFVCLGGFENLRQVYEWRGLKLEVDETKYSFGVSYEVECETSDPEEVKRQLEEFLKDNGIDYKYSEMSKFAVFSIWEAALVSELNDWAYRYF
ncbi:hypothetical protein GH714_012032 [Hevea brasiliensis]|uniref:CYTH domain-containing protein n=1 Tax=Hevea brasiliensis TaxID=3981 RepID=A0A6A6MZ74_HEVBR|nr:hypothetical protein GH714_012032 [Hevea brasiliensis]